MSILTDHQIRDYISKGIIKVDPFDDSLINPASLDIRLGNKFGRLHTKSKKCRSKLIGPFGHHLLTGNFEITDEQVEKSIVNMYPIIDPLDKDSFETLNWEIDEPDGYIYLDPDDFKLASMYENITLPDFISAELKGKSSLGRLGLMNSSGMAGWIDPNWDGNLVMELYNCGPYSLKLSVGMKIGQLIFFEHEPAEKGYDKTGRYYKQVPGQGSYGL